MRGGRVGRAETDFIESNGSAAVGVEYRHQELDGVKIEGCTKSK